jgi:hypothetical protein
MKYKKVSIEDYESKGIDGRKTTINKKGRIGIGEFKEENDDTYTLICTISNNIGSIEEQESYATLISTLLNNNRRFILDRWV